MTLQKYVTFLPFHFFMFDNLLSTTNQASAEHSLCFYNGTLTERGAGVPCH